MLVRNAESRPIVVSVPVNQTVGVFMSQSGRKRGQPIVCVVVVFPDSRCDSHSRLIPAL